MNNENLIIETVQKIENDKKIPEAVQILKDKGMAIFELTSENEDDVYYFKKPNKAMINRYLASATKGKVATGVENLIFDIAIHPDSEGLAKIFKETPGKMIALNNAVQNAIGINEEFSVKKL